MEESLFSLGRLLEVGIIELFINLEYNVNRVSLYQNQYYLDVGEVKLGGSSNDVGLVNTSQRNTVDLERTSNEKKTRVELLQDDNTLTTVTTSQENDNGTRGDSRAEDGLLGGLAGDLGLRNVFSRVEARSLLGRDDTLATILGALDFDGLVSSGLLSRSSNSCLLALVQSLLTVDSRARVARDAGSNEAVSRSVRHLSYI